MSEAHVLVVDGDSDSGEMWEYILHREKLHTKRITASTQLLHEMQNHKYGVVILDADRVTIRPYVAAVRLLRYMKVCIPPGSLVSAIHPNQADTYAEKVGAVANFHKPARLCALVGMVHTILLADKNCHCR